MPLITKANWKQFAATIAAPSEPEEYCMEAVNRLMDRMDNHVVRVKGVKPQFRGINKVSVINFTSVKGEQFYRDAMERFKRRKAKAENRAETDNSYNPRTEILVALLQFRIAAESNPDRVEHIVKAMYESVMQHGQAAVAAFNFKISISKCLKMLMEEPYNVPRDKISVIWGGSKTALTAKKQAKKALTENEDLLAALEAEGITLDTLNLGDDSVTLDEEIKFDEKVRLGTQSRQQRQEEIDKFQRGESLFCFYTFKSGGVGLSLHHTDEYTKFKCRRKESGYVYAEDIPQVPTRQRILFCAPTYSAIELVQGLGRCPRLTSLSDTPQLLIFFADTIEERVAAITNMKLRCLTKIIRMREDWNDIVTGDNKEYSRHESETTKLIEQSNQSEEDEGLITGESESDEE